MGEDNTNRIPKWALTNPSDTQAINDGCYFNKDKAKHILKFADILRHPSGKLAGQKFQLLRWQKLYLMTLFGWMTKEHQRRYKYSFLFIPRGSGKSTLASIVLWYMMLCDGEPKPNCEIAAVDREQASTIYNMAVAIAIKSPALYKHLIKQKIKFRDFKKEIELPTIGAKFKALSNSSLKALGGNNSLLLFDEICAYPNRRLYESLADSINKDRKNTPLCLMLTTAGYDMSLNNIGYEKYQYAKAVLDGSITDTTFLPAIWEAPQNATNEQIGSEKVWLKANPSLISHVLSLDGFRKDYETARTSAADLLRFKRYRLNIFTPTNTTSYIPVDVWDRCKGDTTLPDKHDVWLACDLSSTTDLTGLSLVTSLNEKIIIKTWAYVPKTFQEREKQNLLLYQSFADRGELLITDSERRDDSFIENKILELIEKYNVRSITFDAYQAHELANRLMDLGHECNQMRQSVVELNEPTKLLERLAYRRKIIHDGTELMRWQIQNVHIQVSNDGKLIKPIKQNKDSPNKIDNVVATIMALSQCAIEKEEESVYNTRGILTI